MDLVATTPDTLVSTYIDARHIHVSMVEDKSPQISRHATLVLVCRDPKVQNMNEHPFCVFCTLGPLDFESSLCHAWEHCFGLIIEWLMKLSVLSELAHILRVLEQGHDVCGWELFFICLITMVNGRFQHPWSNKGKANCGLTLPRNEGLGHTTKQTTNQLKCQARVRKSRMCGRRKRFWISIKTSGLVILWDQQWDCNLFH